MNRCIVCTRALAVGDTRTCLLCLGRTRRELRQVAALYALLPIVAAQLPAPFLGGMPTSDPDLPGGDALVMLGPGSHSHNGQSSDPPAVRYELSTWVKDWAEVRSEDLPDTDEVSVTTAWLSTRCGWAAGHHLAFDEFAADIERIGGWLADATGTASHPEVGVPCFACGADLLRYWTDQGLADDWVCPRCARVYPPAHYMLAVRSAYENAQRVEGSAG